MNTNKDEIINNLIKENRDLSFIIERMKRESKSESTNSDITPKYKVGDKVFFNENVSYGFEVEILKLMGMTSKCPLYKVINNKTGKILDFVEETKLAQIIRT